MIAKASYATNRILQAVHETARDLYSAGFIDKRRMRMYDALAWHPCQRIQARRSGRCVIATNSATRYSRISGNAPDTVILRRSLANDASNTRYRRCDWFFKKRKIPSEPKNPVTLFASRLAHQVHAFQLGNGTC